MITSSYSTECCDICFCGSGLATVGAMPSRFTYTVLYSCTHYSCVIYRPLLVLLNRDIEYAAKVRDDLRFDDILRTSCGHLAWNVFEEKSLIDCVPCEGVPLCTVHTVHDSKMKTFVVVLAQNCKLFYTVLTLSKLAGSRTRFVTKTPLS